MFVAGETDACWQQQRNNTNMHQHFLRIPLDLVDDRVPVLVDGLEFQVGIRGQECKIEGVPHPGTVHRQDPRPDLEFQRLGYGTGCYFGDADQLGRSEGT